MPRFHGGCVGCTQPIDVCDSGCQYRTGNWSLPNFYTQSKRKVNKIDPNIAFRDRNRRKHSFDESSSYIVSVHGMSNLLANCPRCQESMAVDVRDTDTIDIKAIRCEDCRLEEMSS